MTSLADAFALPGPHELIPSVPGRAVHPSGCRWGLCLPRSRTPMEPSPLLVARPRASSSPLLSFVSQPFNADKISKGHCEAERKSCMWHRVWKGVMHNAC